MDNVKDIELLPDPIEVYERRIDDAIEDFCLKHGIESLFKVSQNTFSACLRYVYRRVFKPNKTLQGNRKSVLDYEKDIDLIFDIMEYYLYICELYDKAVSPYEFGNLIGLSDERLLNWKNSYSLDTELTNKRSIIIKRLYSHREQSLANKLLNGGNQVGTLATLNHFYGWSLPGVSREESKPRLSRSDMLQSLDALPVKQETAADAGESSQIPQLPEIANEKSDLG